MNNFSTHTITNHADPKKGSTLSRNADGMVLARRVGNLVAWGEDPRQQLQRVFTDETYAQIFLRKIGDLDQQQAMALAGHEDEGVTARIEEVASGRIVGVN